jgi:hypothetical protein
VCSYSPALRYICAKNFDAHVSGPRMPPKGLKTKKAKQPLLRTALPSGAHSGRMHSHSAGDREAAVLSCHISHCTSFHLPSVDVSEMWGVLWVWRRDEIARACVCEQHSGLRMCGCAERGGAM